MHIIVKSEKYYYCLVAHVLCHNLKMEHLMKVKFPDQERFFVYTLACIDLKKLYFCIKTTNDFYRLQVVYFQPRMVRM